MPEIHSHGSLDIAEDPEFQERQWRVERLAWAAGAAVLVLALLGFFGGGPLSHLHWEHSGITVEAERYLRAGVDSTITIQSRALTPVPVVIPRAYWEDLNVTHVEPPAVARADTPDAIALYPQPAAQGTFLRLHCRARRIGPVRGAFTAGPVTFPLRHFVYP